MPTVSRGLYRWLYQGGSTLSDLSDRLNHVWTCGLLLLLAAIISWKQGYSEPMSCWCPNQFTDNYVAYTNSRAWNTYSILYPEDVRKANLSPVFRDPSIIVLSEEVDTSTDIGKLYRPTYYQWLPVILCFQALLFKLPSILMYILHQYSGVNFDKVSDLASGYDRLSLGERENLSRQIARYVAVWSKSTPLAGQLPWRYLSLLWLCVKVLYLINVVTQMTLINNFLSTAEVDNATSYGDVIYDNLQKDNATYWRNSPVFPRHVMFEFSIMMLQSVQRWAVQCTIPANYFNEHAYMFLWVWFLFVAIVTSVSLLTWILRALVPTFRRRYVTKYLEMASDGSPGVTVTDVDRFADYYLGEDGIMVLKLIADNSSDLVVMQVVNQLWRVEGGQTTSGAQYTALPSAAGSGPPMAAPRETTECVNMEEFNGKQGDS